MTILTNLVMDSSVQTPRAVPWSRIQDDYFSYVFVITCRIPRLHEGLREPLNRMIRNGSFHYHLFNYTS